MVERATERIETLGGSVGLIFDTTSDSDEVLGTAWLIAPDKVATCAHFVVLYHDFLNALKVRFPVAQEESAVAEVLFHPDFNKKMAQQMAKKALSSSVPALPLQQQNIAVLTLRKQFIELSAEEKAALNSQLSLPAPPGEKGLSGNLAELDLALIIQTISNARKEGVLVLSDRRNRSVARLFCRDGKLAHVQFRNLSNEMAVYQIVSQHLGGNFYFRSQKEPDFPVSSAINRPTDMLLIEAHRRLDEIPKLLLDLGGDHTRYRSVTPSPRLESLPAEVRDNVSRIWPQLNGNVPIGKLWLTVGLDDYAIFEALRALWKDKQIQEVDFASVCPQRPMKPLDIAPELPLAPWDEISGLTLDTVSGCPEVQTGHLLGSLRPGDPWHLIHNVDLPTESAGSPLFKDGMVIGMHCGTLPPDPKVHTAINKLNQLIWVESVNDCLTGDGEQGKSRSQDRIAPGGCIEVARIDCPRCGSSSLESAKFCKSCGQSLLQDIEFKETKVSRKKLLLGVAIFILLLLAADLGYLFMNPAENLNAEIAAQPLVEAKIEKADSRNAKWIDVAPGEALHNGELIRIELQPQEDTFLYVLHQGTTSTAAHLIFPDSSKNDIRYLKGSRITIPPETKTENAPATVSLHGLTVYGPPGIETLIILASARPSTLVSTPASADKVFEKAVSILNQQKSATGLEVPPRFFGKEVFPTAGEPANEKPIYLTHLQINHGN